MRHEQREAWREVWFGLPPHHVETNQSKRGTLYVLGFSLLILAGCAWLGDELAVSTAALVIVMAPWATLLVYSTTVRPEQVNGPGLARAALRAGIVLSTAAYCAVFGAASPLTASPAYGFLVAAVLVLAPSFIERSPVMVVALGATPLALRAVFVPDASPLSLAVAMLAGVLAAFGTVRLGRAHRARAEREQTLEVERARVRELAGDAPRLAVALSVHDGLSGLVLVARAAAEDANDVAPIDPHLSRLLSRTAALLSGQREASLERAEQELSTLAVASGGQLTTRRVGPVDALPEDDRLQLVELAFESVLNAVRAGPTALTLTWEATLDDVCFDLVSSLPATRTQRVHGGRGLRYAALRASVRGGEAGFEPMPRARLWARWPRAGGKWWAFYPGRLLSAVAVMAPSVLLAALESSWPTLGLAVFGAVAAAGAFREMRAAGHDIEHAERQLLAEELRRAASPERQLVSAALTAPYLAVIHARARGDLAALRAALRDLSSALTRLLTELEHPRAQSPASK